MVVNKFQKDRVFIDSAHRHQKWSIHEPEFVGAGHPCRDAADHDEPSGDDGDDDVRPSDCRKQPCSNRKKIVPHADFLPFEGVRIDNETNGSH